ncbi:MAG: C39 family peptidase [Oscillospiraceae bacterium]|nr:C39 family peptidase [Oscillospiraceae bacterium]
MKKSIKRVISLSLCLAMMAMAYIPAFSAEENTISGLLPHDPARVEEYLSSLTEEELNIIAEREAITQAYLASSIRAARAPTTWSHLPGTFTLYGQITEYYCGPAVVQSTLHYLNKSTPPSQFQIGLDLGTTMFGTDFLKLRPYLNRNQSVINYIHITDLSKTKMEGNFQVDIVVWNVPPIVTLIGSEDEGWRYDSDGHVVMINACRDDRTEFQIADTIIGLYGLPDPYYSRPSSVIHTAMVNFGAGYLY